MLSSGDPRPEAVAGIRRLDSTGLLEPVQGQGIGREIVAPENSLELSTKPGRLFEETAGLVRMAQHQS